MPDSCPAWLQVGEGGKLGKLRPGNVLIPIGTAWVSSPLRGIQHEMNIIVECPDFGVDKRTGRVPTATIPWLNYETEAVLGEKLRFRALPVKAFKLKTVNALQGRGVDWLLILGEYWWVFHQLYTALTRARFPPLRPGDSLQPDKGCVGAVNFAPAPEKLYDPLNQLLGLHPKVAILFKEVFEKEVPDVVYAAAPGWLREHTAVHHTHLVGQLAQAKALRRDVGPSRSYD
jgi:hypothetical protein